MYYAVLQHRPAPFSSQGCAVSPHNGFGNPFPDGFAGSGHVEVPENFLLLGAPAQQLLMIILADTHQIQRVLVTRRPAQRQDMDIPQPFPDMVSGIMPIIRGYKRMQLHHLGRAGDSDGCAGERPGFIPGIKHRDRRIRASFEPQEVRP